MEFAASLDTYAKVTTTGVFILFAGIALWNVRAMRKAKGDKVYMIMGIVVLAVLAFTIAMSFIYSTKGYETKGKSIIIKNRNKEVALKWNDVADVRVVAAEDMKGTSRTFGIGGLFGYSGHYHNAAIGDMTFYATQNKNWVLMHTTSGEAIIVTPDDPDKFTNEVKSIITPNN